MKIEKLFPSSESFTSISFQTFRAGVIHLLASFSIITDVIHSDAGGLGNNICKSSQCRPALHLLSLIYAGKPEAIGDAGQVSFARQLNDD
jgi:hypothetical protein